MNRVIFTFLVYLLSASCIAAENKEQTASAHYWELDVGAVVGYSRNMIEGLDKNDRGDFGGSLVLSAGYYYRSFFIETSPTQNAPLTLGYSAYQDDKFQMNLIAEPSFLGFGEEDQRSGDSLTGIKDREASLDAGLEVLYSGKKFELRFKGLRDVSGTHQGNLLSLDLARPIYKRRWVILPSIGFTHLSNTTTDYYFGIDPSEARADRPQYTPGDGWIGRFNLYLDYAINNKLSAIAFGGYAWVDDNIKNSPLISQSDSFRLNVGLMWRF